MRYILHIIKKKLYIIIHATQNTLHKLSDYIHNVIVTSCCLSLTGSTLNTKKLNEKYIPSIEED